MPRTLLLLPAIVFLLFGSAVFAQESPFGNLTDQENSNRTILNASGLDLSDYLSAQTNYLNLVELHERAFGTRKTELAEQMFARVQDLLLAKMGAVQTYLTALHGKASETKRLSEVSLDSLVKDTDDFASLIPAYQSRIDGAQSIDELRPISREINSSIILVFDKSDVHVATLSIARGQFLIDQIDKKAPIIQAHINASADLGGAVENVQTQYNESMLQMEKAREIYAAQALLIGDGTNFGSGPDEKALLIRVADANRNLRNAYEGLSEVLNDLRVLYSQSPWEIDSSKFEPEASVEEMVVTKVEE